MKRMLSLVLAASMTMTMLVGCSDQKAPSSGTTGSNPPAQSAVPGTPQDGSFEPKDIKNFSIATSMITGTFYILATPLADLINSMDGYTATPEASDGSAANIQMIENEEVYLAITSALTAYQGYNGLGFLRSSWALSTPLSALCS